MASGNPTASATAERMASCGLALHGGDAEPGDRAELRPHHHGADDQDRGVLVDADRGEQPGQDHEGEIDARELDVLRRVLLDLLPHHRVGRRAAGGLHDLLGPVGDLGVDDLERDRAVVVDAELLEVVEQDARVLARDVGEDHVALRPARGAAQVDDVAHGLRRLQHLEGLLGLARRGDDAQVDHGGASVAGGVGPIGRGGASAGRECDARVAGEVDMRRRHRRPPRRLSSLSAREAPESPTASAVWAGGTALVSSAPAACARATVGTASLRCSPRHPPHVPMPPPAPRAGRRRRALARIAERQRASLQAPLQIAGRFSLLQSRFCARADQPGLAFRPTPTVPFTNTCSPL